MGTSTFLLDVISLGKSSEYLKLFPADWDEDRGKEKGCVHDLSDLVVCTLSTSSHQLMNEI